MLRDKNDNKRRLKEQRQSEILLQNGVLPPAQMFVSMYTFLM